MRIKENGNYGIEDMGNAEWISYNKKVRKVHIVREKLLDIFWFYFPGPTLGFFKYEFICRLKRRNSLFPSSRFASDPSASVKGMV